jgi:hypothetical protein
MKIKGEIKTRRRQKAKGEEARSLIIFTKRAKYAVTWYNLF